MNRNKIIAGVLLIIAGTVFAIVNRTDTSPARATYIAVITTYVENDIDLKDYNIDTEKMAQCVLEGTERGMKGFIDSSLTRKEQLEMYTDWVRIKNGVKVHDNINDVREFGMKVVGQGAHTSFGTAYQYCIERVSPHNQEDIAAKEDWVANKVIDISKWWDRL
jgi:hypothetical protein